MTDDGDFLRRWSRRKTASKAGPAGRSADVAPANAAPAPAQPAKAPPAAEPPAPLPPVESLTLDSDFTGFMKPDVDPGLRRQALKVLLRDPRFNVMDRLDVYIDDYSQPDPLPAEWLGQLKQMERLGHYIEPEGETAGGDEKPAGEQSQAPEPESRKAMQEQPVAFPQSEAPADTDSKKPPDPESMNGPP